MYSINPIQGFPLKTGKVLDKKAIAFWAASGFFLENDTFWEDVKWEGIDFSNQQWRYEPRDISFDRAVAEFGELFELIVREQTAGRKVILPLSGGLDSRTLAVALKPTGIQPYSYSYSFKDGLDETIYGREISKALGWPFESVIIPPGYLWSKIEDAGHINGCYADFTHARQFAAAADLSERGDLWLLGHWGDVLFDNFGLPDATPFDEQLKVLKKKILKKGGLELAEDLWQAWGITGSPGENLEHRLKSMHARIPIENANARMRSFKSLYWATRWTTANLSFFSHYKPMALPYYDDRMCNFIMTVPEKFLAGRAIQIEYIKRNAPDLARIPWQKHRPFNLYNYKRNKSPWNLPYRMLNRAKHALDSAVGKPFIQRNWELQFLGEKNDQELRRWLFENKSFDKIVPLEIRTKYYNRFQTEDKVYWSHPLCMLLALSVFTMI